VVSSKWWAIAGAAVLLLGVVGCAAPAASEDPGWTMDDDGRVNLLLVGADSRSDEGSDARGVRTDTLILLSIDVATARAAMFSFPRNMVNAPLGGVANRGAYEGDRLPEFLGYLWLRAAENPGKFPGAPELDATACAAAFDCPRPWRAVAGTVQLMAGVALDGIVAVNLNGFVALVESLPATGVWLDVREPLVDTGYHNSKRELMPLDIQPGCQLMDGEMTLAYARSRRESSDFDRTQRQHHVLQQVRRQVDVLGLLPRAPDLLAVARANLYTTLGQSDIEPLLRLADRVDADAAFTLTLGPNQVDELGGMAGVTARIQGIFADEGAWATPAASATGKGRPCPPTSGP
jgi:LCP family protein required for cell wall assembly